MRLAALLALLSAAPVVAQSTDTLAVGSPAITAAHLAAGVDTFQLYVSIDGAFEQVGTAVHENHVSDEGGRPVLVRGEHIVLITGESLSADTFALARETLAPLWYRSTSSTERVAIEFSGAGVSGSQRKGGQSKPVTAALGQRAFLAAATDLLLGALPLRTGFAAVLPVYDVADGLAYATVEVTEVEEIGRGVQAWRIEVQGGAAPGTYWLDRESRTLVRFESVDGQIRLERGGRAAAPSRAARTTR